MFDVPGYRFVADLLHTPDKLITRAVRETDGRPVILKRLLAEFPSVRQLAGLRREYEITRDLDVDGVVRALALEEPERRPVLVLEDSGGTSLRHAFPQHRPDPAALLGVGLQLARILGRIHARRIIHKDVKPHNVILNPRSGQVSLTDFGIACLLPREIQAVRSPDRLEGTLAYMSPEQTGRMNRALDYRSDFYSLGVTLYELLTGRLPFETQDAMEMIHCHMAREPVSPCEIDPSLPPTLCAVVMKLLAKTPEERYQSAQGIVADLEAIRDGRGGSGWVLGQHDDAASFQLPQQLYGREAQLQTLLDSFDRVAGGATEWILVSGPSGIGKSVLVRELHKPVTRARGYFAAGKFDPYERAIPFSGIIRAFTDLVSQLLTESDAAVARWRAELGEALGPNGRVLVDVVPEVELLMGPQPAVPELPPREARNRFALVFQRFVRVLATADHPLALFLDDLQWADAASLELLSLLVGAGEIRHLCVLGAYRDSEVDASHPRRLALAEMREKGAAVHTIALGALDEDSVSRLVADTFGCDRMAARMLAEVVAAKTGGNAFFVRQLLQRLHRDGLIAHDAASRGWRWDMERIRGAEITDNVIQLMVEEIRRLDPPCQSVLELAAAVGSRFDLGTVAMLHARSREETAADLLGAVDAGLVTPEGSDDSGYRFAHDRVRQAVDSTIPERRAADIHLRLGRHLWKSESTDLFEVIRHLNAARALITEPAEIRALAELNLAAGRRAKASTAYQAAVRHLASARDLLPEDCWESDYALAFPIYRELSECEFLCSHFETAERWFALLVRRARTRLDAAQVCGMRVVVYSAMSRLAEAVEVGRAGLRSFGVHLPEHPHRASLLVEMLRAHWLRGRRRPADLLDAPQCADAEHEAVATILLDMLYPCYMLGNTTLYSLLCLKLVQIAFRWGNSPTSCNAYGVYGAILGSGFGQYARGYEFGMLGRQLNERYGDMRSRGRIRWFICYAITPWRRHLEENEDELREAQRICEQNGDHIYGGWAAFNVIAQALVRGVELDGVLARADQYLEFLKRTGDEQRYLYAVLILQLVKCLRGETSDRLSLSDETYDEARHLEQMRAAHASNALCWYTIMKLHALVIMEDFEGAAQVGDEGDCIRDAMFASAFLTDLTFLHALALARLIPGAAGARRRAMRKTLRAHARRLGQWAASCADNFAHKHLLVAAELARIDGRVLEASSLYDRAIEAARRARYVHHEAIANEAAGRFHQDGGRRRVAHGYFAAARFAYARWGATARVRELDHRIPRVRPEADLASMTSTSDSDPSVDLDLATVLKATQAISSEISLHGVLRSLLRLLMENAGAQKVALLLARDEALFVEAEGDTAGARVASVALDLSPAVPRAIVLFVQRTRGQLVLEDAAQEPLFASDPYVQERRPRSVLCAPIEHQSRLSGIVYLENNLTRGAFTPQRLKIVRLLASQAAISLENATLYETLEQRVDERTRELSERNEALRRSQEEVILQQTLVERERRRAEELKVEQLQARQAALEARKNALAAFLGIAAHDLKNPLTVIRMASYPLRPGVDEDTLVDCRQNIDYACQKAIGLIQTYLDTVQLETGGQLTLRTTEVDLEGLVRDELAFQLSTLSSDRKATLQVEVALARARAVGDPDRLRQVVANLIGNAFKFAPRPGWVKIASACQDGGTWRFEVRDDGPGIAPADQDRLFQAFERAASDVPGSGLGLWIARLIVEAHGGRIGVESAPGQGSRFWFELPRSAIHPATAANPA